MTSKEPAVTTFTGLKVNPLRLRPADICIVDLAHHLALLNRFVGATRKPISIAQHSVYVSRLLDGTGFEMQGLLHDGAEAYLGDVSKWVKHHPLMEPYRIIEDKALTVVFLTYGCLTQDFINSGVELLDWADRLMVRYEGYKCVENCSMFDHSGEDPRYGPPTPEEIDAVGRWDYWPWQVAEEAFLTRFRELTNGFVSEPGVGPAFTVGPLRPERPPSHS